jgi:selenocysteine lyase/cysteine desulfurase
MTVRQTDREPSIDRCTRRDLLSTAVGIASATALGSAAAQPVPELPSSSRELWQWLATQPVLEPRIAYLDAATSGPTLRAAMAAEYRAREIQSFNVAWVSETERWIEETTRLTARYAAFLGCDPDEIAFTRGAGEALSMVAGGLDLSEGDEILTTSQEHPAALSPWLFLARRRGVVIKQIDLPRPLGGPEQALGTFAGAVTDRTKVLMFSHVQYGDGAAMPVRELCQFARQRNITTVIDGAQALGMLDFNLRDLDCDFYAGCFHKWIAGSHGTGMLYVRREMLERLWPTEPRNIEASPPVAFPAQAPGQSDAPSALRRLGNQVPYLWPALKGSEAALDLHQRIGRTRVEARIRELAIYARLRAQQIAGVELLTPARPGLWAGILTFRIPNRAAKETAALLAKVRVFVRALDVPDRPEGAFRLSLHIFNSHDDVEKLMQALSRMV